MHLTPGMQVDYARIISVPTKISLQQKTQTSKVDFLKGFKFN